MTGTAIATKSPVQPEELAKPAILKRYLRQKSDQMSMIAAAGLNTNAVVEAASMAVLDNPDLQRCTVASIFLCVQRSNQLGLMIGGPAQEAHLVPFNSKISKRGQPDQWETKCQLIVGYQGLIKLVMNTGLVSHITCKVLYEDDTYEEPEFIGGPARYVPNLRSTRRADRDIWGCFCVVKMKSGEVFTDFMTRTEIEKCRDKSKQKDGLAWTGAYPEMCKKTMVRRTCKMLPKSTVPAHMLAAIQQENEFGQPMISDEARQAFNERSDAEDRNDYEGVPEAEFQQDKRISPKEVADLWKARGITMTNAIFSSVLLREVSDCGDELNICDNDDLQVLWQYAEDKGK